MDARLTPEQRDLAASAARLADDLGPGSVLDLDDGDRVARLEKAVDSTGWRTLRSDDGSAVEAALVAEEFGRGLVDVPFLGPLLADDLRRRAAPDAGPVTLAVDGVAPDARGYARALELRGTQVLAGDLGPATTGTDLTRREAHVPGGEDVVGELGTDAATRWQALALVVTTADLLGAARGAQALATEYARTRRQYGRAIGGFQGVSHPLAEGLALLEGGTSILRHAAWAVDELDPDEALRAARMAKVWCARAALTVCETSIQVHGGIGNTWECLAHVHLRRVLTATDLCPARLEEIRGLP